MRRQQPAKAVPSFIGDSAGGFQQQPILPAVHPAVAALLRLELRAPCPH